MRHETEALIVKEAVAEAEAKAEVEAEVEAEAEYMKVSVHTQGQW